MTNTIVDCRGMDECCNNIDLIESQQAEIKLLREALTKLESLTHDPFTNPNFDSQSAVAWTEVRTILGINKP